MGEQRQRYNEEFKQQTVSKIHSRANEIDGGNLRGIEYPR